MADLLEKRADGFYLSENYAEMRADGFYVLPGGSTGTEVREDGLYVPAAGVNAGGVFSTAAGGAATQRKIADVPVVSAVPVASSATREGRIGVTVGSVASSPYRAVQGVIGKNLLTRNQSTISSGTHGFTPIQGASLYHEANGGYLVVNCDLATANDVAGFGTEVSPALRRIPVRAGESVTGSLNIRVTGGTTKTIRVVMCANDPVTGRRTFGNLETYEIGLGWTRIESRPMTFTEEAYPSMYVQFHRPGTTGRFDVDSLQIEKGERRTAFEPGGGYTWLYPDFTAGVGAAARQVKEVRKEVAAVAGATGSQRKLALKAPMIAKAYAGERITRFALLNIHPAGVGTDATVLGFAKRIGLRVVNWGRILGGRAGTVRYQRRLYLSNRRGEEITDVSRFVTGASLTMSNYADTAWQMSLDMDATDAFNPFGDYLLPCLDVYVPSGKRFAGDETDRSGHWERFPMGLYLFGDPQMEHMSDESKWSLSGDSRELVLLEDMSEEPIEYPAGTWVLAAMKKLLVDHGDVPPDMISFPSEDVQLSSSLFFNPLYDESETTYIRVLNALAAAGGFYAPKADATGRMRTRRVDESLSARGAAVTYGPEDDALIVGSISDAYNSDAFFNRVIVYSQDVEQRPPIMAVAENRDPNSPANVDNLGRRKTKKIPLKSVKDQATAQATAINELEKASGMHRTISVETLPDPRRGLWEAYDLRGLTNRSGTEVVSGLFRVVKRGMDLSDPPGNMTHELSRGESFAGSPVPDDSPDPDEGVIL